MKRLCLLLIVAATAARAAERRLGVDDFDRVRVDGPFAVHVDTRGTPAARIVGAPSATDGIDIRVEGRTLTVRAAPANARTLPHANVGPTAIYLRTTDLRGAGVVGGGTLTVTGPMRGDRVDLQVSGSGSITASAVETEQLVATLIGTGTLTLGGRAGKARLLSNGAGTIAAAPLKVDYLLVRLDGTGTTHASARYSADVVTSGPGAVTVDGAPKCTVKAIAGGPVKCGVAVAP